MNYKLEQVYVINWGSFVLLQIRANVVTNWDSFFSKNWGKFITNWRSCYKLGQLLLQNRAAIANRGRICYKLWQVLHIRAIIRTCDITSASK